MSYLPCGRDCLLNDVYGQCIKGKSQCMSDSKRAPWGRYAFCVPTKGNNFNTHEACETSASESIRCSPPRRPRGLFSLDKGVPSCFYDCYKKGDEMWALECENNVPRAGVCKKGKSTCLRDYYTPLDIDNAQPAYCYPNDTSLVCVNKGAKDYIDCPNNYLPRAVRSDGSGCRFNCMYSVDCNRSVPDGKFGICKKGLSFCTKDDTCISYRDIPNFKDCQSRAKDYIECGKNYKPIGGWVEDYNACAFECDAKPAPQASTNNNIALWLFVGLGVCGVLFLLWVFMR